MSPTTPPIPSGAVAAVAELLASARLMALGVNRPDGWPQVTTVGYVADGLKLYFVIARDSQKFANIQADPRVSAAIRPEGAEADTVAVIGGRSRAQTYAIGEGGAPEPDPGAGRGVSALF